MEKIRTVGQSKITTDRINHRKESCQMSGRQAPTTVRTEIVVGIRKIDFRRVRSIGVNQGVDQSG